MSLLIPLVVGYFAWKVIGPIIEASLVPFFTMMLHILAFFARLFPKPPVAQKPVAAVSRKGYITAKPLSTKQ